LASVTQLNVAVQYIRQQASLLLDVVDWPWHRDTWRGKQGSPASRRSVRCTSARRVNTGRTWVDVNSRCERAEWTHEPGVHIIAQPYSNHCLMIGLLLYSPGVTTATNSYGRQVARL